MEIRVSKHCILIVNSGMAVTLIEDEVMDMLMRLALHDYWGAKVKRLAECDKNSAIGKGECPFPLSCNRWLTCTLETCDADVCENGRAYRMS